MGTPQMDLKERIGEHWEKYKHNMPGLAQAYDEYTAESYKGGALDAKTKRLMALCAALVSGCRACILYQTDYALGLGASVDEVLETCAVACSLGGTMAAGETARVVQFLEEKGLIA